MKRIAIILVVLTSALGTYMVSMRIRDPIHRHKANSRFGELSEGKEQMTDAEQDVARELPHSARSHSLSAGSLPALSNSTLKHATPHAILEAFSASGEPAPGGQGAAGEAHETTVEHWVPGTLAESKITIFNRCRLPHTRRKFRMQLCGFDENRQWLWLTSPKVASSTAVNLWKKHIRATQFLGRACELLATDQSGSNRKQIQQAGQLTGVVYNHSAIKFGFVRDPLDKLLSAVEELMDRIMCYTLYGKTGYVNKAAFSVANMTSMWNRTTKTGMELLESVGWTKDSSYRSFDRLWTQKVSAHVKYRELVVANLGDQLRRFPDPDSDSGGWDVHLVPQTEWFSDMGVPHSGLEALTDLKEWDASDKVHRTDLPWQLV